VNLLTCGRGRGAERSGRALVVDDAVRVIVTVNCYGRSVPLSVRMADGESRFVWGWGKK
jgi:hypothetical protein